MCVVTAASVVVIEFFKVCVKLKLHVCVITSSKGSRVIIPLSLCSMCTYVHTHSTCSLHPKHFQCMCVQLQEMSTKCKTFSFFKSSAVHLLCIT